MSRPQMPHIPDPFPHEDLSDDEWRRFSDALDLEPALRSMWAGDLPPEQVDIDARAAYRKREHTTAYAVTCPKCRSILAIWVLLGAFTVTVFYLLDHAIRAVAS